MKTIRRKSVAGEKAEVESGKFMPPIGPGPDHGKHPLIHEDGLRPVTVGGPSTVPSQFGVWASGGLISSTAFRAGAGRVTARQTVARPSLGGRVPLRSRGATRLLRGGSLAPELGFGRLSRGHVTRYGAAVRGGALPQVTAWSAGADVVRGGVVHLHRLLGDVIWGDGCGGGRRGDGHVRDAPGS